MLRLWLPVVRLTRGMAGGVGGVAWSVGSLARAVGGVAWGRGYTVTRGRRVTGARARVLAGVAAVVVMLLLLLMMLLMLPRVVMVLGLLLMVVTLVVGGAGAGGGVARGSVGGVDLVWAVIVVVGGGGRGLARVRPCRGGGVDLTRGGVLMAGARGPLRRPGWLLTARTDLVRSVEAAWPGLGVAGGGVARLRPEAEVQRLPWASRHRAIGPGPPRRVPVQGWNLKFCFKHQNWIIQSKVKFNSKFQECLVNKLIELFSFPLSFVCVAFPESIGLNKWLENSIIKTLKFLENKHIFQWINGRVFRLMIQFYLHFFAKWGSLTRSAPWNR